MVDLTTPRIRGIQLEPDAPCVVIEYCIPHQDARANGVLLNHTLMIPMGGQYDDEIEALTEAAQALLADVLEDLPTMPPIESEEADDDDPEDDDPEDDDE